MRRIFSSLLLLAFFASTATAAGINLSWNDCGESGVANKTFTCSSNTFVAGLYASYMPPPGTVAITGNEVLVDLQSAGATLPAWWQFKNVGACRQTALSVSADFTAGPTGCADYWSGLASGGVAAYTTPFNAIANRARLFIIYATPVALAMPMDDNTEYYSVRISFLGTKTVGPGACAGCIEPVCLVLNQIKLTQPAGVGDYRLQNPLVRNFVTWQGGGPAFQCPGATPTRNTTWGSLKSQYR
ncbi:MAG: hypothetical protein HZA61_15790 [Candidatus Eisenbacteria bacterium]|uniref:Uncharacterized protein n=1 Tax=Eiseniibacteriota bacterium TaxID=2212470 RepID=A0A933W9S9_UNCEI|nr:hypothetical protein [Candidatus Eisenbacteria bacterium]